MGNRKAMSLTLEPSQNVEKQNFDIIQSMIVSNKDIKKCIKPQFYRLKIAISKKALYIRSSFWIT